MILAGKEIGTYLAWFAVALAAALAFLAPFPAGSQSQEHWTLIAAFAVLLGAVAIVMQGLGPERRLRIDPVLACLGALAAIFAVQLVPLPAGLLGFLSPTRLGLAKQAAAATGEPVLGWLPLTTCLKCTRDDLLLLIACTSVFYASSRLLRERKHWLPVMASAVAAGVVLALYGLWQVFKTGARLNSTYTNSNRFAGLMAITGAAALGLYLVSRRHGKNRRGPSGGARDSTSGAVLGFALHRGRAWLAAAILIEIALVFTLSRFGIASVMVAGLLTAAVFTRRRAVWAVLAGVLLLLAVNALLAADPVLARYSVLFESGGMGRGRAQCWGMALPLVGDFPLLGSGAGTFKHVLHTALQGVCGNRMTHVRHALSERARPGCRAGVCGRA